MAEYIDRDTLIDEIYGLMNPDSSDIVNKIYAQPSVEAIAVVRCKDCKYCDKAWSWCTRMSEIEDWTGPLLLVEPTDYCKWGEKE
jgi:hypothetical protein